MALTPDPDDATKPADSDSVNYPASYGAAELRALKDKINKSFFLNHVDLPGQEYLVELNGRGMYANYSVNPTLSTSILYGFASNVHRLGKDNHTVGGQFSAYLANNLNFNAELFGVVSQVITGQVNSIITMVAAEFAVCNESSNNNKTKIGCDIVFKDRGDGVATPVGGLGSNQYNSASIALTISSQARGSANEYCGWAQGIKFNEYCMDLALVAGVPTRGSCLDFYDLHYDGGADPSIAYRVDSIMKMRSLQSIMWYDGTVKIRIYLDSFSGRLVVVKDLGGGAYNEIWGVRISDGAVFKNGVLQY